MPSARTGEPPAPPLQVALTGATGFIGRALCRGLTAGGQQVRALVRPHSPNTHHLPPGIEQRTVALDDGAGLVAALAGVDAVIHCAGSVRGIDADSFRAANIDGLMALAAACARLPVAPRVLLISSLAATRPNLSDYARSKALGERALQQHTGLDWTILRPPAVYGPGDVELRPLLQAMRAGLALRIGPRGQRLSLLHVDDLAAAVLAWLACDATCRHQTYAIDDGRPGGYAWPDLVSAARATRPVLNLALPRGLLAALARLNVARARHCGGRPPMLTPGKVRELSEPDWLCDNSPFTAATGWVPRIGLAVGIRRTFEGE